MHVVFIHPDLGVGGAERLIVDAAVAAKSSGHHVTIVTSHYDPNHCFEDTKQLDVRVSGSSFPRHIAGKFHALFAYLKIFWATFWLLWFSNLKYDIVVVDQISLPVIALKWFAFGKQNNNKFKVLFYCHFPDQLLCVYDKKRNFMKRFYRLFIDWLELVSTGMSDVILVNSTFTKNVFRDTFPSLESKQLQVLYPSLNTELIDNIFNENEKKASSKEINSNPYSKDNGEEMEKLKKKKYVFLSINRYERKKNLKLAVDTMIELKKILPESEWSQCHLVHAGGYDYRVNENVTYYDELKSYVEISELSGHVSLLRSISDVEKARLLRSCFCLLYTPTNEHFGIVPIEAMYCEKPVIATNTGGPLETVAHDVTGFLVDASASAFAEKMSCLVLDKTLRPRMASAARLRVINNFSFFSFKDKLNKILNQMLSANQEHSNPIKKND